MKPANPVKRIPLALLGALLAGASLMAQGVQSPTQLPAQSPIKSTAQVDGKGTRMGHKNKVAKVGKHKHRRHHKQTKK